MPAIRRILLLLILSSAACQSQAAPTATPPPTATVTATTAATNLPTSTPTPTLSPTATSTPTVTLTATITSTLTTEPTATLTSVPSITPLPAVGFIYDNWSIADIPDSFKDGIESPMVAFINQNDRDGVGDVRTPQPTTNLETLYFASATNPGARTPILQLDASTDDQVYIAPSGMAIAYFRQDPNGAGTGLYLLDVSVGISGRILPIPSLLQRGFFSDPEWSPDGSQLALALETGYALDIFTVARDGATFNNLTSHPSNDVWPSWSPDGRSMLFVSDRARCASWTPGDANACDAQVTAPSGGNPYVMDIASGEVRQISSQWLTEAPRWVNNRQVAFANGEPALGDPERILWLVDVVTTQERAVRLAGGPAEQVNLAEAWAPNGGSVVFQDASGTANIITLMAANGNLIGRSEDLNFPRFGVSAAWSPDSTRVALGGAGGNCPYGSRIFDGSFTPIARGNPPPSMCDPIFSPNSLLLAFTGVNPRVDGRVDVYVSNNNGTGAVNLTGDLRGQIKLIGWVGG